MAKLETYSVTDYVAKQFRRLFNIFSRSDDNGLPGDGTTDEGDLFKTWFASVSDLKLWLGSGSHKSTTNAKPTRKNAFLQVSPSATMLTGTGDGNRLNLQNFIPYQAAPLWSNDLYSMSVGDEWKGYKNFFMRAAYATSNVVRGGASTDVYGPAVVALFGGADAAVASSATWALNIVGYANASGAVSIAQETDVGVQASGGLAYGNVIVAAGSYKSQNAIQIQANNSSAGFTDGMVFNFRSTTSINPADGTTITTDIQPVDRYLFKVDDGLICDNFFYAPSAKANLNEIALPSFRVSATPTPGGSGEWQYVLVKGSGTGNPSIEARSTDGTTISNLNLYSAGAGAIQFLTGSTAAIQVTIRDTAGATDRISLTGGSGDVAIGTTGSSTNSSVSISGKGNGGVKLRDGAGTARITISTSGVGFFGATPAGQQTAPTALATDGSATSAQIATAVNQIRTALINLGLTA